MWNFIAKTVVATTSPILLKSITKTVVKSATPFLFGSRASSLRRKELSQLLENEILCLGFTQDYNCIMCGTATGYRIYSCDTLRELWRLEMPGAGIAIMELMFYTSKHMAIVGAATSTLHDSQAASINFYPTNEVTMWDRLLNECSGSIVCQSPVLAVKLRHDHVVVVLECEVRIYNVVKLNAVVHEMTTMENPRGLCAVSTEQSSFVVACLGLCEGAVTIYHFDKRITRFIHAHSKESGRLACLALTSKGSLLATASEEGTIINIFNVEYGTKVQELRRGVARADIISLAFSRDAQWLVLSSDRGTIHVFAITDGTLTEELPSSGTSSPALTGVSKLLASATKSSLALLKGKLPKYLISDASFAQFQLPQDMRAIAGFGRQNHTIIIVCANGSCYRCLFAEGGPMLQQEFKALLSCRHEEVW